MWSVLSMASREFGSGASVSSAALARPICSPVRTPGDHLMTGTASTAARDRVLASLAHKQPDRLPVDLASQPDSGLSAVAYDNLRKHIGIGSRTQIYDTVQQLAQAEDAILEHFRTDVIDIGRYLQHRPFIVAGHHAPGWRAGTGARLVPPVSTARRQLGRQRR